MDSTMFERSLTLINSYSQLDLFGIGFAMGLLALAFLTIFYDSSKISKEINKNMLYALIIGIAAYFMPFPSLKLLIMTALLILMIKINLERLSKVGTFFNIKSLAMLDGQRIIKLLAAILFIISLLVAVNHSLVNMQVIYAFYKQLVLLLFGFWMATTVVLRWFKK